MSDGVEVKLALLQERVKSLQESFEDHIADERADLKVVRKEISEINRTLIRYKGTLGGIVLTLSAVAGAVMFAWDWLVKR